MSDIALQYKTHADRPYVEDLQPGECCIRSAAQEGGEPWWMLWFCVMRDGTNTREVAAVPINVRGEAEEHGPGGRTWGFKLDVGGVWQVSPSINVLDHPDGLLVHAGEHPDTSLVSVWHHTPDVVYVPQIGEPWL